MALRVAARNGKVEIVKVLIDAKTNIRTENNYALRWAAHNQHTDVVLLLVKHGADIDSLFPDVRKRFGLDRY